MSKKKTTKEFIRDARRVHGDKYDYSLVRYINNATEVKIICPIHGIFPQIPANHLSGRGCVKCSYINQTKTTTEFIKEAKEIHGNKYDYSLVRYINNATEVEIICPIHGIFPQTPKCHLNGHGCVKCRGKKRRKTTEQFIKEAKKVHGNKYDYSMVRYVSSGTKVKIICPIHGIFPQKPASHLSGCGCAECGGKKKKNTEQFIKEARRVHGNKYDYSLVRYINNATEVKIICPIHGIFPQRPSDHLKGHGCAECSNGSVSKVSQKWLDSLGIPEEYREQSIKIGNKTYKVDALDRKNKIVYEFNGDFWHGNPSRYNVHDINKKTGTTYKELYRRTLVRKHALEKAGYKVVTIWESDFKESDKCDIFNNLGSKTCGIKSFGFIKEDQTKRTKHRRFGLSKRNKQVKVSLEACERQIKALITPKRMLPQEHVLRLANGHC